MIALEWFEKLFNSEVMSEFIPIETLWCCFCSHDFLYHGPYPNTQLSFLTQGHLKPTHLLMLSNLKLRHAIPVPRGCLRLSLFHFQLICAPSSYLLVFIPSLMSCFIPTHVLGGGFSFLHFVSLRNRSLLPEVFLSPDTSSNSSMYLFKDLGPNLTLGWGSMI